MNDTESTAPSNAPEVSVSELSATLKRTVEDAFGYVRVRGEISGYRGQHSSGHAYFCLKDENARLDAVVWRSAFSKLRFKPQEGLEVVATGRITTFPGKSTYQIVIDSLAPAGVGALMALLEERRKKLAAEGLFDAARKRPLPFLPGVIGVVTSPTGAVIRDIIHRVTDRCPCRVVVWPVRVQGETSAAEVAEAIRGFNALPEGGPVPRPDVLIVARGGGSLEDLWSFNEEIVVRAAAESAIPLISAVGHETDTTLIDFVSDRRAPTPTAAAEIAIPVRAELVTQTATCGARLIGALGRFVERRRTELRSAARALPGPDGLLAAPRQKLDACGARLGPALRANERTKRIAFSQSAARLTPATLRGRLERCNERLDALNRRAGRALHTNTQSWRRRETNVSARLSPPLVQRLLRDARRRLEGAHGLLNAYSYKHVLARGYALVRDAGGQPVRSVAGVMPGADLVLQFHDGDAAVRATGEPPQRPATPARAEDKPKKPRGSAPPTTRQGDLFG